MSEIGMKWDIKDLIHIKGSSRVKIISDREVILGVEIYYMEDGTSYSGQQIEEVDYSKLFETISDNLSDLFEPTYEGLEDLLK